MKILLVDDEPDLRKVAELALEAIGNHVVTSANDASEALALVASAAPDLILMDVMMPGMDGPTALGRLRESGAQTPVIFMTAKTQRAELESYLALGARGVIAKPFDPMTLCAEIDRILAA